MENSIKKILEDLYRIDPSLKEKESELLETVKMLSESRPDTQFDKNFAKSLQKELEARFGKPKFNFWNSFVNFWMAFADVFTNKKFIATGSAVIAVLAISTAMFFKFSETGSIKFSQNIKKTSKEAFGRLSFSGGSQNSAAFGLGGGGGGAAEKSLSSTSANDSSSKTSSATAPAYGLGGGGGGSAVSGSTGVSIMPYYTNYKFVYDGGDFTLSDKKVDVLQRTKNGGISKEFVNSIKKLNTGLIDISKFSNLEIQSLALSENKENGYMIYLDLREEAASLSKNWYKWASSSRTDYTPLTSKDMLSDNELISTADKFLKEYNIDISSYGEPEVDSSWSDYYTMSDEKPTYYPDAMSVIYPLEINGQKVTDQGGRSTGIVVAVDIRNKKVSDAYGINSQNYSSSAYDAISDKDTAIKYAEAGGMQKIYTYSDGLANTVELKLDTPTAVLVKYYSYAKSGDNQELYIPALLFKIKDMPKQGLYYYQKYVVVPLVKEFMDSQDSGGITPVLPMEKSSQ